MKTSSTLHLPKLVATNVAAALALTLVVSTADHAHAAPVAEPDVSGEAYEPLPGENEAVELRTALGDRIAAAARAQVGVYQDCTRLVENALRQAGRSVGDLAPIQFYRVAYSIPAHNRQPGDLIYYQNGGMGFPHIAVYIGNNQAVHGGWTGNQTVIFSVNVGSGPTDYLRVR